MEEREGGERKR